MGSARLQPSVRVWQDYELVEKRVEGSIKEEKFEGLKGPGFVMEVVIREGVVNIDSFIDRRKVDSNKQQQDMSFEYTVEDKLEGKSCRKEVDFGWKERYELRNFKKI